MGRFKISNTDSRRSELTERIDAVLGQNSLSVPESASLRSRLLFAEAQIFGRVAKQALASVGSPSLLGRPLQPLTDEVIFHLKWLRDRVLDGKPREISLSEAPTWYLFTDGACSAFDASCSWSGTSIGAVLFGPSGEGVASFGEMLSEEVTRPWRVQNKEQLVYEAEVMPYIVALSVWADHLAGCNLFIFIDNEAAKSSWISASADTKHVRSMLHLGAMIESDLHVQSFFCRVPTHSNIAAFPSRGLFDRCVALGAARQRVPHDLLVKCAGRSLGEM